jgi:uncharacterized protein DUF6247
VATRTITVDTEIAGSSDATPAEVRAALIPEEAAGFDQQWREVMARATETLDEDIPADELLPRIKARLGL